MLRVLTLSTLFPDASRPDFGVFVERQTLELAARRDVELRVVAPLGLPPAPLARHPRYRARAGLPRRECWKGLTVDRPRFPVIPLVGARFSPALLAHSLLPLLRGIRREFDFDVIDAQFFWPDGPAAVAIGKALGVPVSIKARGSDIHLWGARPAYRRQILDAGSRAEGMLAVSRALKGDMAALGMPADRIGVHYTGVDHDRFVPVDRKAAKATLGIDGPLLVCAGHLIERKGQAIAIEAMLDLPGASLLLVGEGPARSALEAQIRRLGLGERVRLLGARPHAELPALLAAADVMVLPSAAEGLANVWVEALACGTPVVTCDVGGAREAIDRTAAGRLVARDAQSIARAVREVLAAPPSQAEVRSAAEHFTWAANCAALHGHLRALAKG